MATRHTYQIEITTENNWTDPIHIMKLIEAVSGIITNGSGIKRFEVKKVKNR